MHYNKNINFFKTFCIKNITCAYIKVYQQIKRGMQKMGIAIVTYMGYISMIAYMIIK